MIVPRFCYNPVTLIAKNTTTERFHPIVYWECPPPSGTLGDKARWKSKGHHTVGFETIDEAIVEVLDICRRQKEILEGGEIYYDDTGVAVEWDSSELPTGVLCFDVESLKKWADR